LAREYRRNLAPEELVAMDGHYQMVMEKIAEAPHGCTRWYFGYSSVLDPAAFETWKGEHGYTDFKLPEGERVEARGMTIDFDFPSRWWGGRAAGLASRPDGIVHGILISIRTEDWPIIQHKEGVITGASVEVPVTVTRGDGSTVEATAFTTNPSRRSHDGPISARFLAAWEQGARSRGLPENYIGKVVGR
jgi:cation transport regulator ChaC